MLRRPTGCEFHARCQYAQEICSRVFPEPAANSDDAEHRFKCHFPLTTETAPALEQRPA
ncbi:hypothetical protein [Mesorhizobium sp. M0910]|uniref:hypothetical protein n=1 Tax=Mesorhizobium sp. M0910 TaxID=2957025 RepID=UPI003338334B